MATVKFRPARCIFCGKYSDPVELDQDKFFRWNMGGELIQNVWPEMSAGERQLLMDGSHEECLDKAYGEEE